MDIQVLLAIIIGLIVGVIAYTILVPKRKGTFNPDNDEVTKNNIILRMATVIGSEIYSALPEENRPKSQDALERTRMLLVRSGNPWQLQPEEFIFIRWVTGLFGLIAGIAVYFILDLLGVGVPWWALIIGTSVFGFFAPTIIHTEKANERDLIFKQQLPEALDLIIISSSSGAILSDAIRESVGNMRPGLLRNEFVNVLRSVDSGRTMREALDDFADRSPNEGVITFVKSLQEGLEMNVDPTEIMKARADSSREELFSLIKEKAAALPVTINTILIPTLLGSLLIVLLSPFLIQFVTSFGNM